MAVLDRSELEASPLADLHTIADQLGLDGFRRLRKADLVDAILGEPGSSRPDRAPRADGDDDAARDDDDSDAARDDSDAAGDDSGTAESRDRSESGSRTRRRRTPRSRRSAAKDDVDDPPETEDEPSSDAEGSSRRSRGRGSRGGSVGERSRRPRGERSEGEDDGAEGESRVAEGVVELLGNGSAFLRVSPPDPSDEDVYISAAQVRRCELISGDRVAGPVRLPRRSERYPSLVRIDTINGAAADEVSEGARYEDLPVEYPRERLALGASDRTLEAIEWLTPLGRGSRAVIVGAPRSGKTETLRRLHGSASVR